jgi:hypothetical protein
MRFAFGIKGALVGVFDSIVVEIGGAGFASGAI